MRRRRALIGLAVLTILGVFAVVVWSRLHRPSLGTFKQVREGMTYDEVCATVGGPPGNYTGGRLLLTFDDQLGAETWASTDAMLFVWFGEDGRAVQVKAAPMVGHYADRASFFRRLLDNFGL